MIQGSYLPESSSSSLIEYSPELEEVSQVAEDPEDMMIIENKVSDMNSDQESIAQEVDTKKPSHFLQKEALQDQLREKPSEAESQ
jgi:hypothetical protein